MQLCLKPHQRPFWLNSGSGALRVDWRREVARLIARHQGNHEPTTTTVLFPKNETQKKGSTLRSQATAREAKSLGFSRFQPQTHQSLQAPATQPCIANAAEPSTRVIESSKKSIFHQIHCSASPIPSQQRRLTFNSVQWTPRLLRMLLCSRWCRKATSPMPES